MRVGGYGWGCGVSYEDDAQAFGDHIRHGGDWRYALLVARWVRVSDETAKVSAREFATAAGVSHATVSRYLKAWQAGAESGLVPDAASIQPGDDVQLEVDAEQWAKCYQSGNAPKREPAAKDPKAPGARKDFFTKLARVIDVTMYSPEHVVELLGSNQSDYEHIEQQVLVIADWVNQVQEARAA